MKYNFYKIHNLMYCKIDNGQLREDENPKYFKFVAYAGVFPNEILSHSEIIDKHPDIKGANEIFELNK